MKRSCFYFAWEYLLQQDPTACTFCAPRPLAKKSMNILIAAPPPAQVPVYWVAQLQLEMLATGCSTVLLVSRSATKARRAATHRSQLSLQPTIQ